MSRIPFMLLGGIALIVTLSLIVRYSYTDMFRNPRGDVASGSIGISEHFTGVMNELNGNITRDITTYWNSLRDQYAPSADIASFVPNRQAGGVAPTAPNLRPEAMERKKVDENEMEQAKKIWSTVVEGKVDIEKSSKESPTPAIPRPKPELRQPAMDPPAPAYRSDEPKPIPDRVAATALARAKLSTAMSPETKTALSEGHVDKAFSQVSAFLKNSTTLKGIPLTTVQPSRTTSVSDIEPKQKPKLGAGKAQPKRLPPQQSPESKAPAINSDLLNKYSQRSKYVKNSSSLQELDDENDFPKLHVCVNAGEAYGASWLATRRHLVEGSVGQFNLTWVNCEMASFTVMGSFRRVMKPTGVGIIVQSLDVLDLSVLHLSTFERSHKRYQKLLWTDGRVRQKEWHNIDPVIIAAAKVEEDVKSKLQYKAEGPRPKRSQFAERTIVVMPFLGGAMGAGHSVLSNRYHYLRACFWSIYEYFPHIVMAVTQESDVVWGKEKSGMPWFDVVLLEGLPKSASLPMGTVQYTRRMLLSNTWDFDYVYYTESDQILLLRNLESYREYLDVFPLRVLVPHRLMTYSENVMLKVHKRWKASSDKALDVLAVSGSSSESLNDWRTLSCCMPRQNCMERETWVPIGSHSVPLLNYSSMIVPLGNANFLLEKYRSCHPMSTLLQGQTSFCP